MQNNNVPSEEQITEMFDNYYILANRRDKYFSREYLGIVSTRGLINSMKCKTGFYSSAIVNMMANHRFKEVYGITHCPKTEAGGIVYFDGTPYANEFSGFKEFPVEDKGWTEEGIAPLKEHIFNVCDRHKKTAKWLTKWIAHNIQFKGEKIHWAVSLVGSEGSGKSLFGELLGRLLGDGTCCPLFVDDIDRKFNDYLGRTPVVIMEGVGILRNEPLEKKERRILKLKNIISAEEIDITKKYYGTTRQRNFTNYILPFNYNFEVPFSCKSPKSMIAEVCPNLVSKYANDKYYERLFDCIENNTAEIYWWLMSIDVDKPNFPRNAPDVS